MPNQQPNRTVLDFFGKDKQQAESQLNQYVIQGTKLIHSPETADSIINMLQSNPDPIQAASSVLVGIMHRLDSAAEQAGDTMNDLVKLEGSLDLLNQIVEVGEASKSIKKKMTPEDIQASLALSVQNYVKDEIAAGRIDKDELAAQVKQGIAQMPEEERAVIGQQVSQINQTVMRNGQTQPQQQNQGGLLNGVSTR